MAAPTTPDGRYFVVRGRLWRCSNPDLDPAEREHLVLELMQARSAKGRAMRADDREARELARERVDAAKHALGERGEPWWTDGAQDYNRRMARNTPYADWFASLEGQTPVATPTRRQPSADRTPPPAASTLRKVRP